MRELSLQQPSRLPEARTVLGRLWWIHGLAARKHNQPFSFLLRFHYSYALACIKGLAPLSFAEPPPLGRLSIFWVDVYPQVGGSMLGAGRLAKD